MSTDDLRMKVVGKAREGRARAGARCAAGANVLRRRGMGEG